MRTKITLLPKAATRSASCAVKTTLPEAAPGEAGRPLAISSLFALDEFDLKQKLNSNFTFRDGLQLSI